ncbi:MAG: F0F1 ATP synthase subunit delta [Saprospiraceae bacterium]
MLIDWFTVIAQIVNFLILVYLLKRFLYKPILNAIDEREQRIASQLEDAAKQKADATKEREQFEHLNQDLNEKKETLLKEAQTTAETERQRLLDKAKKEYSSLRKNLHESLDAEKTSLNGELRRRTQQEVFDISRKVLTDLAGTTLEGQIARVFLQKLNSLGKDEADQLRSSFKTMEPLTVRSAFDLSPEQQSAFAEAIKKLLGDGAQVQFRTSPEEVGGIELSAGGYKIAWTIAEYLDGLEQRITRMEEES